MFNRTDTARQVAPVVILTRGEIDAIAKRNAAHEDTGLKLKPLAAVKVRKARLTHPHAMRARSDAPRPGFNVLGSPPKRTKAQQEADARAHRKRLKLSGLKPLAAGVLVRRAGK